MKNVLLFAAGAVIGSVATYFLVKDKFEKQAQEDIDSVKEVFNRRMKEQSNNQEVEEKEEEVEEVKEEVTQYEKLASSYSTFSNGSDEEADSMLEDKYENRNIEVDSPDMIIDEPYIIAPEEFGALDGYDLISLDYYSDGVLTDDCEEIIENEEEIVGKDYAEHFGEYEEDAVYVRNDRLKADYEILKDVRKFSDVQWRPPHQLR